MSKIAVIHKAIEHFGAGQSSTLEINRLLKKMKKKTAK